MPSTIWQWTQAVSIPKQKKAFCTTRAERLSCFHPLKPPLRGEVARRRRVGGVDAKRLVHTDNSNHFPKQPSTPQSPTATAPLEGSLGTPFFIFHESRSKRSQNSPVFSEMHPGSRRTGPVRRNPYRYYSQECLHRFCAERQSGTRASAPCASSRRGCRPSTAPPGRQTAPVGPPAPL